MKKNYEIFSEKQHLTVEISQKKTTDKWYISRRNNKTLSEKKNWLSKFLRKHATDQSTFHRKKNTKFSYREHCSLKWKKTTPDLWHFSGEKKGNWNFSWKKQRIFLKDIFRKNGLKWKVLRIKITDHWHFSGKKTTDKRYVRRKNNKSFQKKNNNW